MALDPRIALQAQGLNLEPRSNALARGLQLQGAQQQNALRQMQMQQMQQAAQQQIAEREAAAMRQQQMDAALRGLQPVSGINANRASGITGPRPEAAAAIGQRPQADPIALLRAGFDPKMVEFIVNSPNLGRQEVARVLEQAGAGGRPESVQLDKFGQPVGQALPKAVEAKLMDLGGTKQAYDPYALKPGQNFQTTMTPEGRDASARGWAGFNLQRQRLEMDKAKPAAGLAGGAATEGERKAATLLQRLRGSQEQLQAVLKDTPGAAKPELTAEAVRNFPFVGGDTAANVMTSEPRQQVEAAQLDLLDAALTLGTGAAYTREQLEGYRKSYFPQIGDDKKTVSDKQARLQNVIKAAEIAAGRAAPGVTTPGGSIAVDY